MKVWINKCTDDYDCDNNSKVIVFNLNNKNNKSNIKTDMENLWRRFGVAAIPDINEDLLIIALSVFAIDKRITRTIFKDSWSREIEVSIPVLEINKWNAVKINLENTLGFLSGDVWKINFRETKEKFRGNKLSKYNIIKDKNFNCVSLFSGGLDSFSGAVKLLDKGNNVCFVGFKEYGHLEKRQREIFNILNTNYKELNKELLLFNGTPYAPFLNNNKNDVYNEGIESTSRSRSFLFIAGALAAAAIIGGNIPVYIPENGFIGLNVSLTMSRKGTCSTRTTHPYFLRELNKILIMLGIENKIKNFYAFKTKGEIVEELQDKEAFKQGAKLTISCSHPCLSRYDKLPPPLNCGYCYPCLIRRASMNKIKNYDEDYNVKYTISKVFIDEFNKIEGRSSDLKALLWSLNRYLSLKSVDKVKKLVMKTGNLNIDELDKLTKVYIDSMEEIKEMMINESRKENEQLLQYIGIEND